MNYNVANFEEKQVKVKAFVRKGKLVKSYDKKIKKKQPIYQDKDLSGISQGLKSGGSLAGLGAVGSTLVSLTKIGSNAKRKDQAGKSIKFLEKIGLKKIYNEDRTKQRIGASLNTIDPYIAKKYYGKIFKKAGKVALASGLIGAGLGVYAGRKKADNLNKKNNINNITENKKERLMKVAKGLGYGALGAGAMIGLGRLYTKGFTKLLDPKNNIDKLKESLILGNQAKTQAYLREGQRKTIDYYNTLKNKGVAKSLGNSNIPSNTDENIEEIIRNKAKDKGYKIGQRIAKRAKTNNEVVNSVIKNLKGKGMIGIFNDLTYGLSGAGLGVGIYKNKYGKSKNNE
jgi:hypothetical protein